jgi:hypothetical protein
VNGVTNGLHPSGARFEGKGGASGSLTSPALPAQEEGNISYVTGEDKATGARGSNELVTASE